MPRLFQFYVADGRLSTQVYQRSADVFLGVPFNIASYALLTHLVAQQVDLEPGDLVWTGGDCHVYTNHVEQSRLQLSRAPYPFPRLHRAPAPSLFDYTLDDLELVGYRRTPASPPRRGLRTDGARRRARRPAGLGPVAARGHRQWRRDPLAPARGPAALQ